MSIEKKSLISTLKTTKKANVVNSTPSFEAAHKMNKAVVKAHSKAVVKAHSKAVVKAHSKAVVKAHSKAVVKSPSKM